MKKPLNYKLIIIVVSVIFIIASFAFMFSGISFAPRTSSRTSDSRNMPEATGASEEMLGDTIVVQSFKCSVDSISEVAIVFHKLYEVENVPLVIEISDGSNSLIVGQVDCSQVLDQHRVFIRANSLVNGLKDKELVLKVYSGNNEDTGLAVLYSEKENCSFRFGKDKMNGSVCFYVNE